MKTSFKSRHNMSGKYYFLIINYGRVQFYAQIQIASPQGHWGNAQIQSINDQMVLLKFLAQHTHQI